ncbi:phosphatidylserine/phosphatidylglycerophosphate/cardiolipin synthase [Burkholderia sp. Ch1-1]|uniref:phospholipase D family protein n=1 Tax=Paraburkholderia sp. USG1 TaxID=2952268 RepID=UPI0001D239C8|nr:phospholipase D family protein [Paraburkholderia sp. USG1]EIF30215.1 phosphatidylserine/phosphatidylglycerophosphate/cardiolipin synthase [Burkholderia sp. Ch1-1]MDR8399322.1 phospholipase D family protein [Paraburkholderia sp. USG1]
MPSYQDQNRTALQHKCAFSTPRRSFAWGTTRHFFLLCCATAFLTACATRPPATAFERHVTHALPVTEATPLRTALTPVEAAHPDQSGFRVLANGTDALQMRIALARAATRTLDMQYYIANEDTTGKLLLGAALYAADHGVRVRMLVDDLNFKDIDRVMAGLNSHENIEIRVFNPFGSAQQGVFERTTNVFTQIGHFTRRMHNKAMIADNQLAIVGGRNLGDEYFSASETLQFRDLDVLAAGPITADISASFDDYWNSSIAYPLRVLNKQKFDAKELDQTRDELRQHWRTNADPYNAKPLNATPLASQIAKDQLGLTWAPAEFKADLPEKIVHPSPDYVSPPMQRLGELMRDAQKDFLVISPYFVPHEAGVKAAGELTHRGVRIAVLTNSLAATDAVAVQAGYNPFRVPLLQQGVELYEFKPEQHMPRVGFTGSRSRASLHAKTYVIDRKILVIGSMNLDPRSANLNTELALVIHSPPLADQVAQIFERATAPDESYRVTLADEAQLAYLRSIGAPLSPLVWTDVEDGMRRTYIFDPQAGLYRNALTGLFSLLPVNAEL